MDNGAKITVCRKWTKWESDADGNVVADEPDTVREETETYDCQPDDIDREEGLTRVGLAVRVLSGRLYVTETSNYPWSPGSWYGACPGDDHGFGMGGAHEELAAHLSGFTDAEEREIFAGVSAGVPSMR